MNPLYANKEVRQRISDKSMLLYGRRQHWVKVATRNCLDITQIELLLDSMLKQLTEKAVNENK